MSLFSNSFQLQGINLDRSLDVTSRLPAEKCYHNETAHLHETPPPYLHDFELQFIIIGSSIWFRKKNAYNSTYMFNCM